MRLVFNRADGLGVVHNDEQQWTINAAPSLPFEFDGIFYNDEHRQFLHLRNHGHFPLSEQEKAQVVEWIKAQTPPPAMTQQAMVALLQKESALTQLSQLDSGELRALSDVIVNPGDAAARARLIALRSQKDALRAKLQ